MAYAAENDMDLIAIASHGGGEIAWLLGSVAHKVIAHAPSAVLLWRVTEPETSGAQERAVLLAADAVIIAKLSAFPEDCLSRLIRLRGLLRIKINYISKLQ